MCTMYLSNNKDHHPPLNVPLSVVTQMTQDMRSANFFDPLEEWLHNILSRGYFDNFVVEGGLVYMYTIVNCVNRETDTLASYNVLPRLADG